MKKTQLGIYLTNEIAKEGRIKAIQNGLKFSNYLEELIIKDLKEGNKKCSK